MFQISIDCVLKGPINNKSAMIQVMTCCRIGFYLDQWLSHWNEMSSFKIFTWVAAPEVVILTTTGAARD